MRINGIEVNEPNEEVLVLPRKNQDIVFRARAVKSFDEFEALVKPPKAPGYRTKDGFKTNENDPTYRQSREQFEQKRFAYLIILSLEPSNIEWENVNIDDPSTWLNWQTELKEAGFNDFELGRIQQLVLQANALDEAKLEAARKSFLLGEEELQGSTYSQSSEPESMQSGEPAKEGP